MNSSANRKKKNLAGKVKDTYYKLLRKRFAMRNNHVEPDPTEFDEQIQLIEENIHIPNDERIADLKLEERTALERLEKYKDTLPLLDFRKKLLKGAE